MVGPRATAYTLELVSLTDCTRAVASFQPTTITFRFPAVCADANGTVTVDWGVCGTTALACTKVTDGAWASPTCGPAARAASAASVKHVTKFERRFEPRCL